MLVNLNWRTITNERVLSAILLGRVDSPQSTVFAMFIDVPTSPVFSSGGL